MNARENLLRAIRHENPDWVPGYWEAVATIGPPVVERPAGEGHDAFGVHWSYEQAAEGGTYPTHDGHTIRDLARWREQLTVPDVDGLDWSATARAAQGIDRSEHVVQGFVEMGLFERSYLLLGMEAALEAYLIETDAMADLIGAIADYKIALIERLDDEADLDMLWYGDDWGTQDNVFLPVDVWRKTIGLHTRRIYECAQRRGILVNQHSCGWVEPLLDDMVEMGAAMWNPCQPCNDLAALKKRHAGRIAFYGGIDSQFVLARPGVKPGEVRQEVRRRIDEMAWGGGGYVACPSHGVPYKPEILDAMNDEIRTYGREFQRQRNAAITGQVSS